jgi:hypothetical protein
MNDTAHWIRRVSGSNEERADCMGTSMFDRIKLAEISNSGLANAVRKAKQLTSGSYSDYERNEKTLSRLLSKIMELSRKEGEWYLYFNALYFRFYLAYRADDDKAIIKYAEVYYRDSALYMDKELPNYPNTDMARFNAWICGYILGVYENYSEIDDAKMDSFMKRYEEVVLKYGQTYSFYQDEMELAALYRDEAMMEHGRKNFEKYENEIESCYICGHIQYFTYYIMKDKLEKAEELLLDYINRNIPKKYLWCYKYCQRAETQSLYAQILRDARQLGKPDAFRFFYEKYWLSQPEDCQRGTKEDWYYNFSIYLSAIAGNFDALEADCAEAQEDIDNMSTYSTVSRINTGLEWYCYFVLLDKSGCREVHIRLPESDGEQEQGGSCATLAVSRYMERIADENGRKFSQARAKYDYTFTKEAFLQCAGLAEEEPQAK